jgi:cysteinyl-tRNA synthetase
VFEDVVKRYLIYLGYRVLHSMNITDIDETMMKEARKTGMTCQGLAEKYARFFRKDCLDLEIIPPDFEPHASEYARDMIQEAYGMLERGMAYKVRNNVYFRLSAFPQYGELSGKRIGPDGKRVVKEEYKRNEAGDFLLLRPCSRTCNLCLRGRGMHMIPAWNAQCAAMSMKTLGGRADISMGGEDNAFNHHENTRAVASSILGAESSKYWMHTAHLTMRGIKMSKSKRNAVYLHDLQELGFPARGVRMFFLSEHYRKRLDFTPDKMRAARESYACLRDSIAKIRRADGSGAAGFGRMAETARLDFEKAMDNDFDTKGALRVATEFTSDCAKLAEKGQLSAKDAKNAIALVEKFDSVLACLL